MRSSPSPGLTWCWAAEAHWPANMVSPASGTMEKARRAGKIVSVTYLPMRDPGQINLVRNSIARGAHSVCLGIDTDVVYAYRRLLKDVAWSPT